MSRRGDFSARPVAQIIVDPEPPPSDYDPLDVYPAAEDDDPRLVPLRLNGNWSPPYILEWYGPVSHDGEALARLLVACAFIEGPQRINELCTKLIHLGRTVHRKLDQLARDPQLAPHHEHLGRLSALMPTAMRELATVRANAANDIERSGPGLLFYDLGALVHYTHATLQALEIARVRNLIGLERAIGFATMPPMLDQVETWLERLLPAAPLSDIQVYDPPELGRVVIVFNDGTLAYDPFDFEPPESDGYDDYGDAYGGGGWGYDDGGQGW